MKVVTYRRKEEGDVDMSKAERSLFHPGMDEWVRGRVLGQGSFGCVNMAFFPNSNTSKFRTMPSEAAVKSTRLSCGKQLEMEKKILDRLEDCPYIVRCLGDDITFSEDGHLMLNVFLELASGGTLFDLVAAGSNGLPEPQARGFTKSILGGIHRIHQDGLVHSDIKLENVLLFEQDDGDLVAKVADLGLARPAEQSKAGHACGTKQYWAPEMATGGFQGQASDIWALGCVVLSMLTGSLPWGNCRRLTPKELLEVIATSSLVLPPGMFTDLAEDFLYKCFQRDPQERPTAAMLLSHPFVTF